MQLYDAARDGQAQARAFGAFRAEERFKNTLHSGYIHPNTRILDRNTQITTWSQVGILRRLTCSMDEVGNRHLKITTHSPHRVPCIRA